MSSPEIERLIQLLAKLPGLGPRSARRAALHLIKRKDGLLEPLATAMAQAAESVRTCGPCGNLDTTDPFRSMARAYTGIFICRSEDYKEQYIQQMVEKFKVDGILYHDSKTCPNNSNSRYQMPQRLQDKLGKPYLVINGDLNDLRLYSEEQARTNIEAFVEQLLGT